MIGRSEHVKKLIKNDSKIVQSGRSLLLKNIKDLSSEKNLQELKIFVPHVNWSESDDIIFEFTKLRDKNPSLRIAWLFPEGSNALKQFKKRFQKHAIEFFVLNKILEKDEELNQAVRYYITKAFLGKPETAKFDIDNLRKAIKVCNSGVKENEIPDFFKYNTPGIEGASDLMIKLKKRINRVAATDLTVLLKGETGTGKDGAAFFLHDLSDRRKNPFEVINCAQFNEDHFISELFGHMKGAFTGANENHDGLITRVNGGTLFFDEIPEMTPRCQAMLLRFLEDGRIKPMGANEYINKKYEIRIICAGQPELIKQKLRPDLLFRIAEVTIDIPSLRDITQDLQGLIDHLLYKMTDEPEKRYKTKEFFLSKLSLLESYHWTGNIRELSSFVKRRLYLGVDEEEKILNEIKSTMNDSDSSKKNNIPNSDNQQTSENNFMVEFRDVISKYKDELPTLNKITLAYTHYVSEALKEKTKKDIAEILKVTVNTRRDNVIKFKGKYLSNEQ